MTFANPHALWLLLLLPLLLFARRREPLSRVPVAALHLWKEMAMAEASAPSRRLRRHWVILLQAACLAAMIVALARPMLALGTRTVAIVIDTSLSMSAQQGDTTRLKLAERRITRLVEGLPRATRVRLVAAGPAPRALGEYPASDAALLRAVGGLDATAANADLDGAIERAKHADGAADRVYVVTDSAVPSGQAAAANDVEWITVGGPANNVAITALSYRRQAADSAQIDVLTEIRNFGSTGVRADLVLQPTDAAEARESIAIAAHGSTSILTTLTDAPGVLTARLDSVVDADVPERTKAAVASAKPDAIAADNVRRTVVEPLRSLRVGLTGGGYFIRTALSAHEQVTVVAGSEQADVIVCDGCDRVPDGTAGVFLISPRPEPPPTAAPVTWTGHPLARLLNLDHLSLVPAPSSRAADESAIVARAGGLPVVLAYESNARRIVEWRLDPDAAGLPLSPAFPVLVARSLEWLDRAAANTSTIDAGEPLQWNLPATVVDAGGPQGPPLAELEVTTPDGRSAGATVADSRLLFADTSTAGVYRARLNGQDRTFVVNPAADRESDVSRSIPGTSNGEPGTSNPEPGTSNPEPGTSNPEPGTSNSEPGTRTRNPEPGTRNLSSAFLLLALIFLGVEWHYRRHRRSKWRPA